jgi:apolipoprotein D and lipocalin family protein
MTHRFRGLLLALALAGCSTTQSVPMPPQPVVDLARFMGDWYVIANIPTFIERGAYNAVESYRLAPDGTVPTTFTFHQGAFDGPLKRHTPKGFVRPGTGNAIWGMQFLWPFKAEYVIAYVDPDYRETIIARSARDYVWIMARTPEISAADYAALVERVGKLGYDVSKLQRVPQKWP